MASDEDKKIVIVAGLDGDFKKEPFGDILKIIPICDNYIKLHALCKRCNNGTLAPFTRKNTKDGAQICVGLDEYESVCRKHWRED